jgi:hypothetical protein
MQGRVEKQGQKKITQKTCKYLQSTVLKLYAVESENHE